MKILVTGATGLLGSALRAKLAQCGHRIVAVARPGASHPPAPATEWIEIDMAKADRVEVWRPHLEGVDAVINCAGSLQDGLRREMLAVHSAGPAALFAACEQLAVRRVIHISAVGVDREQPSSFSRSKIAGDEALMQTGLDWIILRPSVMLGDAAFGSSALFRGLAALPWLPLMPATGKLQVVQIDDVTETVIRLLGQGAPSRMALELVGPERLEFSEIVDSYRCWLGWKPAKKLHLPKPLAGLIYRLGDLIGMFGWRPPIRSTAAKEIARGAVGDPTAWTQATGIIPSSLDAVLVRRPASVQERWFAKLYFIKPMAFVTLALFWIATGVISLTTGFDDGVELMRRTGASFLAGPSVVAGALADMVIGLAIAIRRTARWGLYGALALSAFYVLAATALQPELWSDPLGPLLKIGPILVLHLMALAILEER
jgi:uncharacterized protein YbjT (DUF2867 family)